MVMIKVLVTDILNVISNSVSSKYFGDKEISLLNSALAFPDFLLYASKLDIKEVNEIVKNSKFIVSYIGHEATAKLLSTMLGVNISVNRNMFYPPKNRVSYAIAVKLKKRLEKPQDIEHVTENDLEFMLLQYIPV